MTVILSKSSTRLVLVYHFKPLSLSLLPVCECMCEWVNISSCVSGVGPIWGSHILALFSSKGARANLLATCCCLKYISSTSRQEKNMVLVYCMDMTPFNLSQRGTDSHSLTSLLVSCIQAGIIFIVIITS